MRFVGDCDSLATRFVGDRHLLAMRFVGDRHSWASSWATANRCERRVRRQWLCSSRQAALKPGIVIGSFAALVAIGWELKRAITASAAGATYRR